MENEKKTRLTLYTFLVVLKILKMLRFSGLIALILVLHYTDAFFPLMPGDHVIPHHMLRVAHTNKFVAFSAGLTQIATLHASHNDTVPYDRVFLNMGGGYNKTNGIFTSPRTGTYVFMYYALAQQNKQLQLDLYRNDDYIVGSYAHVTSDYGSVSNSVILGLDEKDTVHIKAHTDDYLYGQPDEIYTSFTGFLLVPDEGRTQHGSHGQAPGQGVFLTPSPNKK
ncbi:Hypothetical predicted protein [Mytilus galloprovincialis]|uniref:C1q domain-containing protein n=2 Tax=Mytilus galloprovincialis TaxID=29158 RepID=A0A8B6CFL6_MYTGA|nr:Hypothetical predicted protein [Mytilus galloprovincialis]